MPSRPFRLRLIRSDRGRSLLPAILGIEHNQWAFRKTTWSEVFGLSTASQSGDLDPPPFLGEASRIDEPVVIIGLTKNSNTAAGWWCPMNGA